MLRLRQVQKTDLTALSQLAEESHSGFVNLPKNKNEMKERIEKAVAAFSLTKHEPENLFIFVLEESETKKIFGTSSIKARASARFDEPFFRKLTEEIGGKSVEKLHLIFEPGEVSELCGLFLSSQGRKKGVGKLLSLSRILFIAEHPSFFSDTLVADLRGVSFDGRAPFWSAVGEKLTGLSFDEATILYSENPQAFFKLLPKDPIYVPLLPQEAIDSIGKVHANSEAALHLLEKQGFRVTADLHPLEAGPRVEALTNQLDIMKQSLPIPCQIQKHEGDSMAIVSRVNAPFIAVLTAVKASKQQVFLSEAAAVELQVNEGELCRLYLLD